MSFIKGTIRRLKSRWPKAIEIYRADSISQDLQTGIQTTNRSKISIPKAIVLPAKIRFQLGLSEGGKIEGFLQAKITTIILDNVDLGSFQLDIENCQVIIGLVKYEIVNIQDYNNEATVLDLKAILGEPLNRIFDFQLKDLFTLEETIEH